MIDEDETHVAPNSNLKSDEKSDSNQHVMSQGGEAPPCSFNQEGFPKSCRM
jgi:hypothetical protein